MSIQKVLKKVERTRILAKDLRQDDKIPKGKNGDFLCVWDASLENGVVRVDLEDGTYAEFPPNAPIHLINRTLGPLGLTEEELGFWAVHLGLPIRNGGIWTRDENNNSVRIHDFVHRAEELALFDEVLERYHVSSYEKRVDLTADVVGWWVTLWGRGEPENNGMVKTRFYGDSIAEACLKAIAAKESPK